MNDEQKVQVLRDITSSMPLLVGRYDRRRRVFIWQAGSQTLGGLISAELAGRGLRAIPPGFANEENTVVLSLDSIEER